MKKETALKRIRVAVEKAIPNESNAVKEWFVELTYLTFYNLEMDTYEATSTENLKYAISVNLEDELSVLLKEAREETK